MQGLSRDKEIYLAPTFDEEGNELLPQQAIAYDQLVIALGSQTNDFGTKGAKEHCIMLDSSPLLNVSIKKTRQLLLARTQTEQQQVGGGRSP